MTSTRHPRSNPRDVRHPRHPSNPRRQPYVLLLDRGSRWWFATILFPDATAYVVPGIDGDTAAGAERRGEEALTAYLRSLGHREEQILAAVAAA